MCPIVFEKAMARDPGLIGTFSPCGDSMIYVNKEGQRLANEKLAYNEMAQVFFQWDGARSEYPNLLLIAVWDQRSQQMQVDDLDVMQRTTTCMMISGWELTPRK